jgi:hypothetical protein
MSKLFRAGGVHLRAHGQNGNLFLQPGTVVALRGESEALD